MSFLTIYICYKVKVITVRTQNINKRKIAEIIWIKVLDSDPQPKKSDLKNWYHMVMYETETQSKKMFILWQNRKKTKGL
jgi:hypothetical protein